MLRLAGIVLTLIGVLHQLGATCSGCEDGHAWLTRYGHHAMHAFVAQTHAHEHPGHRCQHHDPMIPREHSPDSDGHHHATHLCSATHATYPPPAAKIVFVPDLRVEWLAISGETINLHDAWHHSLLFASADSVDYASVRARAELQVFQI